MIKFINYILERNLIKMSKSKEQCMHIIAQKFNDVHNDNDLESLSMVLNEIIKEITNSEYALIWKYFEEDNSFIYTNNGETTIVEIEESIMKSVFLSKKGFFDNYVMGHQKYNQNNDNPLNIKIKSLILVPILDKSKENVLGFISAFNSVDNISDFKRYDIRSLSLLENEVRKLFSLIVKTDKVVDEQTKKVTKEENIISHISDKDLKQEIEYQAKKILELEEKLIEKENSTLAKNNDEILYEVELLDDALEQDDSSVKSTDDIKNILDFLMNEVTYLAHEGHKIYLFLEIIKNSLHNKEQLRYINNALNQSQFINNLANDLYERDKMPLLFEEFNTFIVFSTIANLFSKTLSYDDVTFNVYIDPLLLRLIVSDLAKVKSLIIHLINNIHGLVGSGGTIDLIVTSSIKDKTINIEIKGRPEYSSKHIKKLFHSPKISHSLISSDRGLGLSVSSNMVNILGGKLKLLTKEENEHSFLAIIPVEINDDNGTKKFPSKNRTKVGILMSDENELVYLNIKRYLLRFGFTEANIIVFKNPKKMGNLKLAHLICFENMLNDKADLSRFDSLIIMKFRNEILNYKNNSQGNIHELYVNSYYGMVLQKILFPNMPIDKINRGTVLTEDSFLRKFNQVVSKLKLS